MTIDLTTVVVEEVVGVDPSRTAAGESIVNVLERACLAVEDAIVSSQHPDWQLRFTASDFHQAATQPTTMNKNLMTAQCNLKDFENPRFGCRNL
jgi:hypothetical protein